MLRIAICDDDERCLKDTKRMIERWSIAVSFKIKIICFDNCDSLLQSTATERYDIIFLDIIMPLLNGMEAAQELRERDATTKIIFLTSSAEFAIQSYSVKATDYCMKPVAYERLKKILDDCTMVNNQDPANLTVKTINGYQKIYFHDIEVIEAQNKRVLFFLKSHEIIEVMQPFYCIEKELSRSDVFFKCHRSYLVYLHNVDFFNNNEIKTKSGRKIPIARGYGKAFQEAYFAAIFKE